MKKVLCQFDDYVFAALQNAAERLGNTIEHVIEFAVIEAVTGRKQGDHIEEQEEDFSPGSDGIFTDELAVDGSGRYGKPEDIFELTAKEASRLNQKYRHRY